MIGRTFVADLLSLWRGKVRYMAQDRPIEFVDENGNVYVSDGKFDYDGHVTYIHIREVVL